MSEVQIRTYTIIATVPAILSVWSLVHAWT